MDYSNSRGAIDMGLAPQLLPGFQPSGRPGMTIPEMLAAADLDVLWVVGGNPLKSQALASTSAFVVVQEMFMTETAQRADIVLPAASAYEKDGTVTNVCGQVQKLTLALKTMGTKPDLEIIGLLAKEMKVDFPAVKPDAVFDEIRKTVHGYNIPLPVIATGGAAQTTPVNGRVPVESRPELIQSARDTLFTSGSLGRYSKTLNSVLERPGELFESGIATP
jgi:NADH-quinone oxidoreductase subunit G